MARFIDLTGKKFGRLVPMKFVGKDKSHHTLWLCRCDCGREKIINSHGLKNGNTRSCGCLRIDRTSKTGKNNKKHGHARKGKTSKTYSTWKSIIQRCNNPKNPDYKYYKGRGITVCKRWSNKKTGFQNFLKDMGERPKGLSIDRTNNDGNYNKRNCRWATSKQQASNKKRKR